MYATTKCGAPTIGKKIIITNYELYATTKCGAPAISPKLFARGDRVVCNHKMRRTNNLFDDIDVNSKLCATIKCGAPTYQAVSAVLT